MREEYTAMHGLKLSTQQEPTTGLVAVAKKGVIKRGRLIN